jgi:hypothetical protein
VAAELARRWNFPAVITNTLARVPEPHQDSDESLLGIVRTAVWMADRECLPTRDGDLTLPKTTAELNLVWDGTPPVLSVSIGRQPPRPVPPMAELTAELAGLFDD